MSAIFNISKGVTKDLEGGYWNDKSAGYTYNGISYKYFPNWEGWPIIFSLATRRFGGIAKTPRYTVFKDAKLDAAVDAFKKKQFWDKFIGDGRLLNQDIANMVYDFIFHKMYDALTVINYTARSINKSVALRNDRLSDAVVQLINNNQVAFYVALRNNRRLYYLNPRNIPGTKSDRFSTKMANGFVKTRVNSFPATTKATQGFAFFSPFKTTWR